jgi:hypothetical protein
MSILIHIKNEKYNSKIIHEQFGINQIYSVLENLDFRLTKCMLKLCPAVW